ncbi:hypothetical protein GCM10010172_73670 [Paractinoplanes ferrugineus]|uniref:Uncharacterized protein n=1 Tax=Paractinoplanes ferrugineus TaxID=113564 RepID=A0A919MD77_9ACTN|nr:DUF3632 domain-containing protein [Actinoplanes ferrugineus]GIE11478.1 hypothetical protein Afe05nite_33180 [Actinoplanes ferrugineus]
MTYEEALAHYRSALTDADAFVAPLRDTDDPEAVLWAAWQTVTGAAATADDPELARLVDLVTAVQRRELPGVRVWNLRVCTDLPVLGAQLREEWNGGRPIAEWTALNSFAARLTAAGTHDALLLGLWTISAALETFDGPPENLPAAVEWFRHAGSQLAGATVHGRTYAARLGPLAEQAGVPDPPAGFSFQRWAFWRRRLESLSTEGARLIKRYDSTIATGRLDPR